MRIPAFVPPALLLAALTACGPSDSDPGPGGVTVGEARALDEAAAMLDERRAAPEPLPAPPASATAASEETGDGE
jgi:hypothetical protein